MYGILYRNDTLKISFLNQKLDKYKMKIFVIDLVIVYMLYINYVTSFLVPTILRLVNY